MTAQPATMQASMEVTRTNIRADAEANGIRLIFSNPSGMAVTVYINPHDATLIAESIEEAVKEFWMILRRRGDEADEPRLDVEVVSNGSVKDGN